MPASVLDLNEKRFERLAPRAFAREVMRVPAKRRMELILERPDAETVVAALDANDFFYSLQEIGADDALPMLSLASLEQVNHVFDLEWWRKDSLEPAKALTWLERLSRANERKLVEWIYHADFELLVAGFKSWITVDMLPEDTDLVEARESLPPKTLDDLYFWESKYPQFDDLIMHMLSIMFEISYDFFKELMNALLYALGEEVEEEAYRFHRGRLSDHAVPEYYDALEIYRAVGPGEVVRKTPMPAAGDDVSSTPSFAVALLPDTGLLKGALARVRSPELAESLQFELAALANKVIVADEVPLDNAEALRNAVEKALAYVNLGLEMRSGGNEHRADEAIGDTFLEHLFRMAQAEVARVRGRLLAVVRNGWLSKCPTGLKCLDREWYEAAEELLGRTPRVLRQKERDDAPGAIPRFDFFRTPRDLARGERLVDVIEGAGFLYEALNADPREIEALLWPEGQVSVLEDITLGVMVLTAAARFALSGEWAVAPLPVRTWPEAFARVLPADIDRAVMDWVHRIQPDTMKRTPAMDYLSPLLRDYDAEMGRFTADNPPEATFVKFFLFCD